MISIGVLGGRWRAAVDPSGGIEPADGAASLAWHVAADDRWHTPAHAATVRQRRIAGTAVVETRIRIPGGDAVQRVCAVADRGGMTVVEVENDSPLPIAVAFEGARVVSARPPTPVPVDGIELAGRAAVFPIGHRSRLVVAVSHVDPLATVLPPVATHEQVARGWLAVCGRAGVLAIPDSSMAEAVTAERCEVLLAGPGELRTDPAGFLIAARELVRLGEDAGAWLAEVAEAVHLVARLAPAWDRTAALDAAAGVLATAGEVRALRDLARVRGASGGHRAPEVPGHGVRRVAWTERILVRDGSLLPDGLPPGWLGQPIEVHGLPAGPATTVSFALRWHGERPAVLWEQSGEPIALRSPALAPEWSSDEPAGEALWPPLEQATRV